MRGCGGGGEEAFDCGPGAELVVDAAAGDEFLVQAERLRGLRVVEFEFPVDDAGVVGYGELAGDGADESWRLCCCEGTGVAAAEGEVCEFGEGRGVGGVEADDGDHVGLFVILACHADAEMRSEGRDTCDYSVSILV
jgi:hypothetical protein